MVSQELRLCLLIRSVTTNIKYAISRSSKPNSLENLKSWVSRLRVGRLSTQRASLAPGSPWLAMASMITAVNILTAKCNSRSLR